MTEEKKQEREYIEALRGRTINLYRDGEGLRTQVSSLQGENGNLRKDIGQKEDRITQLKSDKDQLQKDKQDLEKKNTDLSNDLATVRGERDTARNDLAKEKEDHGETKDKLGVEESRVKNLANSRNNLSRELGRYIIFAAGRRWQSAAGRNLEAEYPDYENFVKNWIPLEDLENKISENFYKANVNFFYLKQWCEVEINSILGTPAAETFIGNLQTAEKRVKDYLEWVKDKKSHPLYRKKIEDESGEFFAKVQRIVNFLRGQENVSGVAQQIQLPPKGK